jgi:hypothetical protein
MVMLRFLKCNGVKEVSIKKRDKHKYIETERSVHMYYFCQRLLDSDKKVDNKYHP